MRGGGHPSSKTPSNCGTAVERVDDEGLATGGSRCSVSLPESLVRVLSDPGVLLAGVGVSGDVCRLEKEYGQLRALGVNGVVDLSQMANMKVKVYEYMYIRTCVVRRAGFLWSSVLFQLFYLTNVSRVIISRDPTKCGVRNWRSLI